MATLDDMASDREEKDREMALRNRREAGPLPCGQCYNCGEVLSGDRRWCDADCREDWEMRNGG